MRWAAFALLAACAPTLYHDHGPFPFSANDTTALLSGCGERVAVGHLYCRFQSGTKPSGDIVVMVPPVQCPADSCASVTILGPDGAHVLDLSVPKGKTWVTVPWVSFVGPGAFSDFQRGFWPVLVKWSWVDETGTVQQAMAEGEIRLRVYHSTYSPLTYDPESQSWTWEVGGVKFGATDRGRSAILVTP